jgi:hypothetical protein
MHDTIETYNSSTGTSYVLTDANTIMIHSNAVHINTSMCDHQPVIINKLNQYNTHKSHLKWQWESVTQHHVQSFQGQGCDSECIVLILSKHGGLWSSSAFHDRQQIKHAGVHEWVQGKKGQFQSLIFGIIML